MLILADADGFRVDLHKLGERILQAARDGDRAAQRNVEVRQFGAGIGARGIDRRARFRHHDLRELQLRRAGHQFGGELVRLARGGAVADGDQLDLMLLAEAAKDGERLRPLPPRLVRIDRRRCGNLAGGIHHRDLHAGAEARIEAHRGARAGGRGEQEIAQIAREHPHRLFFRRLPKPHAQIHREMPLDARPPCPAHGVVQPFVGRTALIGDVEFARDAVLVKARAAGGRLRRVFRLEIQIEHALLLAAKHREDAVRGHLRKRLRLVEIVGELRAFGRVLLVVLRLGGEAATAPHLLAQIADEVRVFAEALDQDRARAFERGCGVGDALLGIR